MSEQKCITRRNEQIGFQLMRTNKLLQENFDQKCCANG